MAEDKLFDIDAFYKLYNNNIKKKKSDYTIRKNWEKTVKPSTTEILPLEKRYTKEERAKFEALKRRFS